MTPFADRIQLLGTENAFKLGDDIARCEQSGIKVIKLNLGEPDFDSSENINQGPSEARFHKHPVRHLR